jgi:tetratricopeptide (TPR) repeat protein
MKTRKIGPYFVWIIFLVFTLNTLAQVKEVPITTSSKEALNLFLSGRDKLENIEFFEAAPLFDKAIQLDPNFALAYLYRASSGGGYNVFRQNLDKAVSISDKVSEGEKLQILFVQAQFDGNGLKQKEYLDQLLKSFPSDKRIHYWAGGYYYGINDFPTALVHLTKSAVLDNKYAPAYNLIGYCQSALGNYQEAEKAFQTYIELIPNNANPYDSYAELLLKMGKYDESIAQYKKALEKDPMFTTSLAGIGNNYIFKGDYGSARKYYQEYFDKAPTIDEKFSAIDLKATSFIHEGKIKEALTAYDEYRALAEKENLIPNTINSYLIQGLILAENGNSLEGMKYFQKSIDFMEKLKLQEAEKENFATFLMIERVYFLAANGELDKATDESEKCISKVESRKDPVQEMTLNSIMGYLECKKGNYDKAIQYFSKGTKDNPFYWYYTALAFSNKGDKQNALKLFEKITKWNVNSTDLALVRKRASAEMKK